MAIITSYTGILLLGSLVAYWLWKAVYNVFFHPLAKIPGPWLPAVTPWYEVYFDIVHKGGGQYPFHVKKLHKKYGPIIRPVPDQVHIDDPEALDIIYAVRKRNKTPVNIGIAPTSAGSTEENGLHKVRRDAINPFFSQKMLLEHEWLMDKKKARAIAVIDGAAESGGMINLSDIIFAYISDFIRSSSFGSDKDLIGNLTEARRQRENLWKGLKGVHINRHFMPLWNAIRKLPRWLRNSSAVPISDLMRFHGEITEDIRKVFADTNDSNKGQHTLFYELRDSALLPSEERTVERVRDEAVFVMIAGNTSTARSLGIAVFYLAYLEEVYESLRKEILEARRNSSTQLNLSTLMKLPYLNAVITEADRLSFGATGRNRRYAPDETVMYTVSYGPEEGTTYAIPPKTQMSTYTYCTNTNESLFPDPLRFDPKRWIVDASNPENSVEAVNRRRRSMHVLGKGFRICPGKGIAHAAMSLMLAELIDYDITLFETDENDINFQFDLSIAMPKPDTKGIRAYVRRR